jgi:type II secretory pathway pseudopilin PulG
MTKYRRKKKLIKPALQLYFARTFLACTVLILSVSLSLTFFVLAYIAADLPNDGGIVLSLLPKTMAACALISILLFSPVLLWVGVLVTFKVAGPLYRFEVFLRQVMKGEHPEPCRIRKEDKLQDFCALLNEVTQPLREAVPAQSNETQPPEEVVEPLDEQHEMAPQGSERGFALPDTLMAIAVVAVAVGSLASAAVSSSQLRRTVAEKSVALQVLKDEIREIESTPFVEIMDSHHERTFLVDPEGRGESVLNVRAGAKDGRPGLITVSVPNPPGDAARLLDVLVRIEWESRTGPQSMARTIRISRLGGAQ